MTSFKEREPAVIGGLSLGLIILWLGFLVHRSPDFPGSLLGHSLGILGALLMQVPLAYMAVKRIRRLRKAVTERVSMRTLLAWHIYAGIVGPILVLLHTGHHFDSPLGIALTSTTIVVAISGFVGRYLMKRVNTEIRELKGNLEQLRQRGGEVSQQLAQERDAGRVLRGRGMFSTIWSAFFVEELAGAPAEHVVRRAVAIADAQADIEYALSSQTLVKTLFSRWLKIHITISMVLTALLALHVWATLYFGLRWLT